MSEASPAEQTVQRQYDFDVRGEKVKVTTNAVLGGTTYQLVIVRFDEEEHSYGEKRQTQLNSNDGIWTTDISEQHTTPFAAIQAWANRVY